MATGDSVNAGFEKNLWSAACVLWGHIPAADYRKVIVGLIFLRYISYAFEKRFNELVAEGDGFENDPDAYAEVGAVIDNAMREIEADNKKLKNVLPKKTTGVGNMDCRPPVTQITLGFNICCHISRRMVKSDSF